MTIDQLFLRDGVFKFLCAMAVVDWRLQQMVFGLLSISVDYQII